MGCATCICSQLFRDMRFFQLSPQKHWLLSHFRGHGVQHHTVFFIDCLDFTFPPSFSTQVSLSWMLLQGHIHVLMTSSLLNLLITSFYPFVLTQTFSHRFSKSFVPSAFAASNHLFSWAEKNQAPSASSYMIGLCFISVTVLFST